MQVVVKRGVRRGVYRCVLGGGPLSCSRVGKMLYSLFFLFFIQVNRIQQAHTSPLLLNIFSIYGIHVIKHGGTIYN